MPRDRDRYRLTGWKRPDPTWIAPVRERCDGMRVHLMGLMTGPDGASWSLFKIPDACDPLWILASRVEPTQRRALLLYANLRWPLAQ